MSLCSALEVGPLAQNRDLAMGQHGEHGERPDLCLHCQLPRQPVSVHPPGPRESGLPHFQHKHVAGGIGKCCNMSQLLLWFQDIQRTKTLTTNSPLKDLGILFWHIFTLYFWDFDRFPDGFRMFPGCPSGAVSPLSPLSQDLFRKAKNPDRVIAGVCFQVGIHWP